MVILKSNPGNWLQSHEWCHWSELPLLMYSEYSEFVPSRYQTLVTGFRGKNQPLILAARVEVDFESLNWARMWKNKTKFQPKFVGKVRNICKGWLIQNFTKNWNERDEEKRKISESVWGSVVNQQKNIEIKDFWVIIRRRSSTDFLMALAFLNSFFPLLPMYPGVLCLLYDKWKYCRVIIHQSFHFCVLHGSNPLVQLLDEYD